ncbi:MAG: DUF418 domain-containing protein [Verrucomicrobiae bacterium]|nr:DUF418 domain-containing protein [Verrucomicrobiae bacterium]
MKGEAETLGPVDPGGRIHSVDTLRGVAVLGILLMNIVGMGLPDPAYWDPSGYGGAEGWNLWIWAGNEVFVEGTMRGLFSMLFGASVILFTGKGDANRNDVSIADAWYRRTIWLFLFGIIHGYVLLWPGDILYAYGLMGMFLFPLRRVRSGRLLALGAALLMTGAGTAMLAYRGAVQSHRGAMAAEEKLERGEDPSPEERKALDRWSEKRAAYQPDAVTKEEEIAAMRGGYLSAAGQRFGYTYFMQSQYHYRHSYWDILGLMIVGMALFKWGVFSGRMPIRTYALMGAIGYGVGLPINAYETIAYFRSQFDLLTYFQMLNTYQFGRTGVLIGHVGLIMLVCRLGLLAGVRRRLAAVGRMALTNYLTHTVVTTFVFVGLAQYGAWERYQLYLLVLAIWAAQLWLSPFWLRYYRFGPVEWLWRRLTYLQPQPFRRAAETGRPEGPALALESR